MTLDAWIASVTGQALLFDGIEADRAQCVQLVSFYLKDVLNVPVFFANAIDWFQKFDSSPLTPNFTKHAISDGYPKKGDIVIWGAGVGSQFGHIDVCISDGNPGGFLGFDSNWSGNKTAHQVQHDYRFVLGYLRFKGEEMKATYDFVRKEYTAKLGRVPDADKNEGAEYVDRDAGEVASILYDAPEAKAYRIRVGKALEQTGEFEPVGELFVKKS